MNVKYLNPYKDDPYGKIRGDKRETYFAVHFEEAKVYKTDDSYILVGKANHFQGIVRSYNASVPLEEELVALPIYGKDYEIRSKDSKGEWQSTTVKPSVFEKLCYNLIARNENVWTEEDKGFSFKFTHIPDGMVTSQSDAAKETTLTQNFTGTPVVLSGDLPEYTPPKNYRANGKGGKSYGLSPEQRVESIKTQLKKDIDPLAVTDDMELAALMKQFITENAGTPGLVDVYFRTLAACAK